MQTNGEDNRDGHDDDRFSGRGAECPIVFDIAAGAATDAPIERHTDEELLMTNRSVAVLRRR